MWVAGIQLLEPSPTDRQSAHYWEAGIWVGLGLEFVYSNKGCECRKLCLYLLCQILMAVLLFFSPWVYKVSVSSGHGLFLGVIESTCFWAFSSSGSDFSSLLSPESISISITFYFLFLQSSLPHLLFSLSLWVYVFKKKKNNNNTFLSSSCQEKVMLNPVLNLLWYSQRKPFLVWKKISPRSPCLLQLLLCDFFLIIKVPETKYSVFTVFMFWCTPLLTFENLINRSKCFSLVLICFYLLVIIWSFCICMEKDFFCGVGCVVGNVLMKAWFYREVQYLLFNRIALWRLNNFFYLTEL